MSQEIVIIGNGVAGITAAFEARELAPNSKITVISKEAPYFFSRTALMYEFCGQMSRRELEPYERKTYSQKNINLLQDEVLEIAPENQIIKLKESGSLTFDKLLLATGSKPRSFPWQTPELKNIGGFVSIQDLEWLKEYHQAGQIAVVIGGGLIGIEACEILLAAGLEVHFLIRDEWFWPIALNQNEAKFVAEHLEHHGLQVHLNTEVVDQEIINNKIKKLVLSDGKELEIDLLVTAIGVEPQTDFLKNSDIKLDQRFGAIEANSFLQTNFPNIFTAGDCANVEWFNGVRRPEQIWYTSKAQGRIAGRNIVATNSNSLEKYQRGIFYNSSKLFDIEYTTAGLVNFPKEVIGGNVSEWYQQVPNEYVSQRIVVKEGKVIGFNMLGSRWEHNILSKWIAEEKSLNYVLENLKLATFDAEFSPRFKIYNSAKQYDLY